MEEKMSLSLYKCALCTLKFPSNKIRYSQDGKKIICIDCYNKIMKKGQKAQVNENRQKPETKLRAGNAKGEGIEVICANCNYKFFYRPKLKPTCPYCGKNKLKRYEELTADKLIKDSVRDNF